MWAKGILASARARRRDRARSRATPVLAAVAVTVGLLSGCSAKAETPTPPSASTLIGAGKDLYQKKDYAAAAQLFEQAVAADPADAIAHYDLGTAYQAEHRNAEARAQYRQAVAHDPSMVSALFNEAILDTPRDPVLAVFLYHKVVAINPDASTAWLNLGVLEHKEGLKAGAGVAFRRAVGLEPGLRAQIPAADLPDLSLPPPRRIAPTTTTAPAP